MFFSIGQDSTNIYPYSIPALLCSNDVFVRAPIVKITIEERAQNGKGFRPAYIPTDS